VSALALTSLVIGTLWLPTFYWGVRHKSAITVSVALWVWMVNAIIGFGEVTAGRLLSIPWILVVNVLLIERLLHHPEHLQHVCAVQVQDARRFAHDQINDAMSVYAQDLSAKHQEIARLKQRLADNGIEP
jgi:hypothetical protein